MPRSHMRDLFLEHIKEGTSKMSSGFSLVASENQLSNFAASFLNSEFYGRYSFDTDSSWGNVSFPNGKSISSIRKEITHPILAKLSCAEYVNTKPISGISCLTTTISAFCSEGSSVLILPENLGGHPSTKYIIRKLGLKVYEIPTLPENEIDFKKMSDMVEELSVTLIYIDHANSRFEFPISMLKAAIRNSGQNPHIHYDSSHLNALILGGAMTNPLAAGADSFGGSLHKSFPGPHKGFFATNDFALIRRFNFCSDKFISHEHTSDFLALTASLLEFDECGGREYANNIIRNAQLLESTLMSFGAESCHKTIFSTQTHQIHLANFGLSSAHEAFSSWLRESIVVNYFDRFLGKNNSALRLGVSEITKLGFDESGILHLAEAMKHSANNNCAKAKGIIDELKSNYFKPLYCYEEF